MAKIRIAVAATAIIAAVILVGCDEFGIPSAASPGESPASLGEYCGADGGRGGAIRTCKEGLTCIFTAIDAAYGSTYPVEDLPDPSSITYHSAGFCGNGEIGSYCRMFYGYITNPVTGDITYSKITFTEDCREGLTCVYGPGRPDFGTVCSNLTSGSPCAHDIDCNEGLVCDNSSSTCIKARATGEGLRKR